MSALDKALKEAARTKNVAIKDLVAFDYNFQKVKIRTINPLRQLHRLKYLGLTGNRIGDLSPLEDLIHLEQLYLQYNPVKDLSPLRKLT